MNLEEALKLADEAVFNKTGEYLSDLQKLILQECWDNKTYDQIALAIGYDSQHVKNQGSQLWKLLKDALGEKVSKTKFRAALERYQQSLQNPDLSTKKLKIKKVLHNLPQPDYINFVGRKEELIRLRKLLHTEDRVWVIVIDGVGGIGKSALALEIAYYYLNEFETLPESEEFKAIIWVSAKSAILTGDGIKSRGQVDRSINDIYKAIAICLEKDTIISVPFDDQHGLVKRELIRQRTLLIIDNLETIDDERVNSFIRELPSPTKCIVTTRHRIDIAEPIRLTGMSKDETLCLITQECDTKKVQISQEEAELLFKRTGGVPLAVVWSISQVAFGYEIQNVLHNLGNAKGDIARFCFENALFLIKDKPAYILLVCICISTYTNERKYLGQIAELSELDRDENLVALENLSLVNNYNGCYNVIPLVKEYILAKIAEIEFTYLKKIILQISKVNVLSGADAVVLIEPFFKSNEFKELKNKVKNAITANLLNHVKPYYQKRHGTLKVLGMREPVPLESVYTAVQFLDNYAISSFESIENLEQFYRQASSRRFQFQDKGKQEGIIVANKKQYLMVLGAPGIGKSTFLRKMGLEALNGQDGGFKHDCIPVFIELKRFQDRDINIENFIVKEFSKCEVTQPEQFTTQALKEGKLLILLDGLDEVPTKNLTNVISHIEDFVETYKKNRFIASCRVAAYRSRFRNFSDVTMADFDDNQIQQFIKNWFHSETDKEAQTGDKCWELLQKPENAAAKELAYTPLLLTFLCLVYDRSQKFPNNHSVLYRQALRILLEEWASEKKILRDEIYQGLHPELEEILLSEIAYISFQADRLFFSKRDIVQQIKEFLARNLNAPQSLDGEAVLNAIVVQQGILVEQVKDVFSFSHLRLQEYLTAKYIDDYRLVEKLVTEHLTDKRWKEVFLLVAGLMRGGADDLLLRMEKEAQKYINTPKLRDLLNWAEQATTGSAGDLKPVGKRAVAIAIANANANAEAIVIAEAIAKANAIANANAYANAYVYAKANAKAKAIAEAIKYTRQLEELTIFNNVNFTTLIDSLNELLTKIPDEKQPQKVRQEFPQRLQQTLLNAFNLSPDIINLSQSEAKALENYLYANNLLIQYKKASVRVSPQTWEGIEARMLLVQSN